MLKKLLPDAGLEPTTSCLDYLSSTSNATDQMDWEKANVNIEGWRSTY